MFATHFTAPFGIERHACLRELKNLLRMNLRELFVVPPLIGRFSTGLILNSASTPIIGIRTVTRLKYDRHLAGIIETNRHTSEKAILLQMTPSATSAVRRREYLLRGILAPGRIAGLPRSLRGTGIDQNQMPLWLTI